MKTLRNIIISIIVLLSIYFALNITAINIDDQSNTKEVKTADIIETKDYIIFSRFGNEKGIYNTTTNKKNALKIIESKLDMLEASQDKLVFNNWGDEPNLQYDKSHQDTFLETERKDKCLGIFTSSIDGNNIKCLANNYIMSDRPAINVGQDLIIFVGEKVANGLIEECIDYGVYSLSLNGSAPVKLHIQCDSRDSIKDISFFGENKIVYSKNIYNDGSYYNQIFEYDLDLKKEEILINSRNSNLNPVVSPDGKKLAYLSFSQSVGKYGIFITDMNNLTEIMYSDINDAVVGGSLKWSPDSNKILYIVLPNSSQGDKAVKGTKVKITDIAKYTSECIGEGYIGTFSEDSRSIAYASYKIEENENKEFKKKEYKCTETIYKRKIGGDCCVVLQFDEGSLYSKSINTIYWYK